MRLYHLITSNLGFQYCRCLCSRLLAAGVRRRQRRRATRTGEMRIRETIRRTMKKQTGFDEAAYVCVRFSRKKDYVTDALTIQVKRLRGLLILGLFLPRT